MHASCLWLMVIAAAPPAESEPSTAPVIARAVEHAPETEETRRAKLLGRLLYTPITATFDQVPVREALRALRNATGVPIVGRWNDDPVGLGMDPDMPVDVQVRETPLLDVLEQMIEQCGLEECSWQLRRGFVEVSTKERLSVPSAREARLHEIGDLLLEPPTFSSKDSHLARGLRAGLRRFNPGFKYEPARPDDTGSWRKTPMYIGVEITQEICERIEPGHWDYGQPLDRDQAGRLDRLPEGDGAGGQPGKVNPAPLHGAAPPPLPRRAETDIDIWASIRIFRRQLVVTAPDFIHRQIIGYPEPIKPEAIETSVVPSPVQSKAEGS